jgi:hypothetical protein
MSFSDSLYDCISQTVGMVSNSRMIGEKDLNDFKEAVVAYWKLEGLRKTTMHLSQDSWCLHRAGDRCTQDTKNSEKMSIT